MPPASCCPPHLVTDLERVCDYLIVLVASQVRIAGEVSDLLSAHRRLAGPRRNPGTLPADQEVIEESQTHKQSSLLVRTLSRFRPGLDCHAGQHGGTRPGLHEPGE